MNSSSSSSTYFCSDSDDEKVPEITELLFQEYTDNKIIAFGNNFKYIFELIDNQFKILEQTPIDFSVTSIFGPTYQTFVTPIGKFGVYKNKVYQLDNFQLFHTLQNPISPFQVASLTTSLLISSIQKPFYLDLLHKKTVSGIDFHEINNPYFFTYKDKVVAFSQFQDKIAIVEKQKYMVIDFQFPGLKRIPTGKFKQYVSILVDDSFSCILDLDQMQIKVSDNRVNEVINCIEFGQKLIYGENQIVLIDQVLTQFK
eukprot:EST43589.1 Hypothetical protein SS50377_16631 [Spironucleus salmonicida]